MKLYCTKGALFISFALLLLGAAACTQSKPNVPTPTLVPLSNQNQAVPTALPPGTSDLSGGTLVPANTDQTPGVEVTTPIQVPPTNVPGSDNATPVPAEPTLLPTPETNFPTAAPPPASTDNTGGSTGGATGGGGCSNPYTVKHGDWFYQIARTCGVSPQALAAANPRINPNYLVPGMVLNIPGGNSGGGGGAPPPSNGGSNPPPSGGGGGQTYVVRPGDTLFSIAAKFGTDVNALMQANNIPDPRYIFAGQTLTIP